MQIMSWEILNALCEIHAANFVKLTKEINIF
jgi:hypothetical protein